MSDRGSDPSRRRGGGAIVGQSDRPGHALVHCTARTFHAGVDHLAFQIVAGRGVDTATAIVADSDGAYYTLSALTPATHLGWIVLAFAAYRSGTFGGVRAVALGLMAALMGGLLKGSDWISVAATAGLCVALVPLRIEVLRAAPVPSRRVVTRNTLIAVGVVAVCIVLGRLG